MKRVLIFGSSGSGKSTLARQLSEKKGLPHIYMDQHYFAPGWVEPTPEVWAERVTKLVQQESWVMDGNYGGTMHLRIPRADTIIFLNLPVWICLFRILKRWIQYRGQIRPGAAEGCEEKMDLEFIHYVATYPLTRRPGILKKLAALESEKQIYILNSRKAVRDFWNHIDNSGCEAT